MITFAKPTTDKTASWRVTVDDGDLNIEIESLLVAYISAESGEMVMVKLDDQEMDELERLGFAIDREAGELVVC